MPPSSARAVGPKEELWEHHRPEIRRLYMEEEWSLGQVMKHMEDQYNFIAKKNQFAKYFLKWRLVKKLDPSTWSGIYPMVCNIQASGNEAEVWVNGFKKSPETVQRQTARYRNRPPGKLPTGVLVRKAPSPLSSQITVSLPFHGFVRDLRDNLPLIPVRNSAASSSTVLTAPHARDTSNTKTQMEQALQAVVPSDLDDSGGFQLSPIVSDQGLFAAPLHRNILFSVANNFAGLHALPKETVIDFLQRKTSHEIYSMIKSCREYYTSQALAFNLFRAAIEVGNAMAVDFFLRESWPGIEVNSFICFYDGIRQTPVERASALLHKDVVKVLVGHGALVTKYDRKYPGQARAHRALICAVEGMVKSWKRRVVPNPELLEMLVEAGGKLDDPCFRDVIQYELSGRLVCLILKKQAAEDHRIWSERGVFIQIFEYQSHETCLRTLETMVQIGADLNPDLNSRRSYTGARTILDVAAGRGDLGLVRGIFQAGAVLSSDTLCCAISSRNIELVYHLLEVGARMDTISYWEITPLAAAILSEDQRLIDLVVHHDGEANLGTAIYFRSALEAACEAGNTEWIHRLLNIGDVVLPARDLGMALLLCAKRGQTDSAIKLIDAGADTNFQHGGAPPLFEALKRRDSVLVRALLEADANPNYYGHEKTPAVALAVQWGDRNMIVDILRAGGDPNDGEGFMVPNPMTIAINSRDREMMDFLLDAGCDINKPSDFTALRAAVNTGDRDLVADVLDRGADPHDSKAIADSVAQSGEILDLLLQKHASRYPRGRKGWGGESLVLALKQGDHGLFSKLLQAGADANQFTDNSIAFRHSFAHLDGTTAFGHAIAHVKSGDIRFVELLLNRKGQPGYCPETIVSSTRVTKSGYRSTSSTGISVTAFLAAIGSGNMATINAMLLHDADVNFPASLGVKRTPLQRAAEIGNIEAVELLLQRGADVNAPAAARGGGTALQLAAHGGFHPIVRLLTKHKADPRASASKVNGRSPLEGAAEMGRLDMVAELLKSGAVSRGKDIVQLNRAISLAERNDHLPLVSMLKRFVDEGKVSNGPPSLSELWTLSEEEI